VRIVLIDDQDEFRASLADLLSRLPEVEIVGEASDGREGVALALRVRPDVVLMDIRMPAMDGIAATTALRKEWAEACILVLTTFDDDELIAAAMHAGATGYLLKGTPIEDLVAILHLARRGYIAIGRTSRGDRSASDDEIITRANALSRRARQIWELIGEGHTNAEIAGRLFLTKGTVKNYVTAILGTLQVRHRTEAALLWRHTRARWRLSHSTQSSSL
jgi:DNA-binding NarL/FixJ family response regulator